MNLKPSDYNFIYNDLGKDRIVFYNAFTGALAVVKSTQYQQFKDLPEDAAPQPEAEPQKQPKPRPAAPKQEQPPVPLHLCPVQPAHQEGQAEGRFYHAGGRVCSHP